jgi:hypothetical protein
MAVRLNVRLMRVNVSIFVLITQFSVKLEVVHPKRLLQFIMFEVLAVFALCH